MITTKKVKKQKFQLEPISAWGVEKYGVKLEIDPHSFPFFDEGCSLDVEDNEQGEFVGCGIYNLSDNTCYYWSILEHFQAVVLSKFIAHNGISDIRKLQKWGFKVDESWLLWDTFLIGHILDSSERTYGLRDMSVRHLRIDQPKYEDLTGKKTSKDHTTLDKLPLELVANYNALQCYTTYKLYEKQRFMWSGLDEKGNIYDHNKTIEYYEQIEKPSSLVFSKMEERGIKVDLEYLRKLKDTLESHLEAAKAPILNDLGNINLDSPKQLLEALNRKGLTPILKGRPSTDKRALDKFRGNHLVDSLLKYSEISTLLSSFVYPYSERGDEIVHPHFNQTGTRTGRPSCSNPNLLQIPRRTENGKLVRKMFTARDGMQFGDCDYKAIEPKLLAHLSKDSSMLNLFNAGTDFHDYFAEHLQVTRDTAKVFDLEVYYRATEFGVARTLNCSLNKAKQYIEDAWNLFPQLYDWQQRILYQAKKDGYVTTLLGRRIKIEDLNHGNEWRRAGAERQMMNNLIQGSAAEVIKMAMIAIHNDNRFSHEFFLLIQVYDQLLAESKEIVQDIQYMKEDMEKSILLDVPLNVEAKLGYSWGEMSEAKA